MPCLAAIECRFQMLEVILPANPWETYNTGFNPDCKYPLALVSSRNYENFDDRDKHIMILSPG